MENIKDIALSIFTLFGVLLVFGTVFMSVAWTFTGFTEETNSLERYKRMWKEDRDWFNQMLIEDVHIWLRRIGLILLLILFLGSMLYVIAYKPDLLIED